MLKRDHSNFMEHHDDLRPNYGAVLGDGFECIVTRKHHDIYPPHLHINYELLAPLCHPEYVVTGNGHLLLNPGDLLVIAPNTLHARHTESNQPVQFCTLMLTRALGTASGWAGLDQPGFKVLRHWQGAQQLNALALAADRDVVAAARLALAMYVEGQYVSILGGTLLHAQDKGQGEGPSSDALPAIRSTWGYSENYFYSAFKDRFGISPHQFSIARRLDWARSRLFETGGPIADVAIEAGFYDQAHFSRLFKRRFKCSPGRYLRTFQLENVRSAPVFGERDMTCDYRVIRT